MGRQVVIAAGRDALELGPAKRKLVLDVKGAAGIMCQLILVVLPEPQAVALDPELGPVLPAGSGVADALEAIAIAARGWVLRFGPGEVWPIAAVLSGGVLLCNTSCPFPPVR